MTIRERLGARAGVRTGKDALALVASQVGALGLSFVLTPVQLRAMGSARYGVLAVTAALMGYLSFFDVGIGWALTHFVPYYRGVRREDQLARLIFAGLFVSSTLGAVVGAGVWLAAPWLSVHVIGLDGQLASSARFAIRVAGLSLPVMLVTSVLAGIGRGLSLFSRNAIIHFLAFGSLNIAWTIVASNRHAIELVSVTQLAIAILSLTAWIFLVRSSIRTVFHHASFDRAVYARLLGYGFYSSVASMGYLLLIAADKLILAAVVPVSDVVYYAIPFALASQIPVVSTTVAAVLFPRFSASAAIEGDAKQSEMVLADKSRSLLVVFSATVTCAFLWGGDAFLRRWIGADFAHHASFTLHTLAVGFGVLSLGSIDQVYMQAHGRVRTTAVIFLLSGGGGVVALGLLASRYGVAGAAVATGVSLAVLGLANVVAASISRAELPIARTTRVLRLWALVCLALSVMAGAVAIVASLPPVLAAVVLLATVVSVWPIGRRTLRWSRERNLDAPWASTLE